MDHINENILLVNNITDDYYTITENISLEYTQDNASVDLMAPGSVKNDFGQSSFFEVEISKWIQFTFGALLTATAIFGIFGNFLSISVLMQKQMRSSISVLLIGLACCDLVVCLLSVFLFGLPIMFKELGIAVGFLDWSCVWKKYIFPWASTAQTGSAYFTVLVTFDRYIAVCRPLRARSICTWERAKYFSAAIVLFSLVLNIPRYILYYSRKEILYANHTCESNQDLKSESAEKINYFLYLIFIYLIPLCMVIFLNTAIIQQVRKQNATRDTMSRSQLKQIKLTKMLITVVTVYITCNIFRVMNVFTKLSFNYTSAELIALTNFLVTLNSAVNYLIYCAFGKTFRQSFVTLFCNCGRIRRSFSTRRNAIQGKPDLNLDTASVTLMDFFVIRSIRRFSKDFMNIVGRSEEYAVNT